MKSLRMFTIVGFVIGALIVVFLPIGTVLNWPISSNIVNLIYSFVGNNAQQHYYVEVWEIAAILWSLIYLILYNAWAFPKAYGGNMSNAAVSRFQWGFTMGTVTVGIVVFLVYRLYDPNGLSHTGAQLLIILWLVIMDLLIVFVFHHFHWVSDEVYTDYRTFLTIIDLPALISLSVIFSFMALSIDNNLQPICETLNSFGAGAAAMDLLLVNFAFAIIFFRTQD